MCLRGKTKYPWHLLKTLRPSCIMESGKLLTDLGYVVILGPKFILALNKDNYFNERKAKQYHEPTNKYYFLCFF